MNITKFVLGVLLLASELSYAGDRFDCSLLVGKWAGENIYEHNSIYSKWEAILSETGEILVNFQYFDTDGEKSEIQIGTWACDGELVRAVITTDKGDTIKYSYKIIELTNSYYKNQHIAADGALGPIFESSRVQ